METATDQQVIFSMSAEDVPEEALSRESYAFLADTYHDLSETVKKPLAAVPDPAAAAAALLRRQALILARRYLSRALYFILVDKRYHPEAQIRVDARGTFGYNAKLPQDLQNLVKLSAEARGLMPSVPSAVAEELRMLHLCADIFFELLERVFPLREIGKCRMGFSLLMRAIGTSAEAGALSNYERRHKTMYRAILNWQENGGTPEPNAMGKAVKNLSAKIDEMKSSVDANTRTVANMDRRQKSFFDRLKPAKEKIVALFRQAKEDPYAAVTVGEPRRSQLIEVIDYTMAHPIVLDGKSRDAFTLSNAARAVWNMNHRKWETVKGGYETFEALKGACYGLQQKQNDPFRYQSP